MDDGRNAAGPTGRQQGKHTTHDEAGDDFVETVNPLTRFSKILTVQT